MIGSSDVRTTLPCQTGAKQATPSLATRFVLRAKTLYIYLSKHFLLYITSLNVHVDRLGREMSNVLTSHSPFKKRRHSEIADSHGVIDEPARSQIKLDETRKTSPAVADAVQADDSHSEDDDSVSSSIIEDIMDSAELEPCYGDEGEIHTFLLYTYDTSTDTIER